jgi:hypothetical protein
MNRRIALGVLAWMLGAAAAGAAAQSMEQHESKKPAAPSTELTIVAAGKTTKLSMADLQAMPQISLKVHNGHTNEDETYTGVAMSVLLAKYGFTLEGSGAAKVYHSYVKAQGTDGYWVLYSASELEPTLATWDSLVAITVDGKPLGAEGAFKVVAGGERKPARWVRNLSSLTIVTAQ